MVSNVILLLMSHISRSTNCAGFDCKKYHLSTAHNGSIIKKGIIFTLLSVKHNTLYFSPGGHSTASVSTGSHGRSDISAALLEGVNLVEERRHWEHMGEGMGRPRAHTDHEPRGDHLPLNRTGE